MVTIDRHDGNFTHRDTRNIFYSNLQRHLNDQIKSLPLSHLAIHVFADKLERVCKLEGELEANEKKMMKKCVLLLLIVSAVTSQLVENRDENSGKAKIRRPRSILGFFQSIFTIHQLHQAQKTDLSYTLARVYDIMRNSFSDTATKKVKENANVVLNLNL